MNTKQMEIFTNVVRYGNFSNAAKKMYLSQPAISSSIDALEKELGVKLFLRQGRKVVLTEKGEDFYKGSISILNMTAETLKKVTEQNELNGTIRIIANHTAGIFYLPKVLSDFRIKYPGIYFDLYICSSNKVIKHVLEGRFDVGITGIPIDHDLLRQKCILSDKLIFTSLDIKPFINFPRVLPLELMLEIPFISRTLEDEQITIFEAALYSIGKSTVELNVVAEMNNNEAVLAAVMAGMGMAVLPRSCILERPELLEFEVDGINMWRNHYAITKMDDYLSDRADVFYQFMNESIFIDNTVLDKRIIN